MGDQIGARSTFLAANVCKTPVALISLVDANRQGFTPKVDVVVPDVERVSPSASR